MPLPHPYMAAPKLQSCVKMLTATLFPGLQQTRLISVIGRMLPTQTATRPFDELPSSST